MNPCPWLLCTLALLFFSCSTSDERMQETTTEDQRVSWRLTTSFPKSLANIYDPIEEFAERVETLSGGNFSVRVYQAGELVPPLEVFDAVQQGSVEMGQSAGVYYMGKNPAFALETGVPFGFSPRQQNAWFYEGGGLEAMQNVYSKYDIYYLPVGNTGAQMGGWFRKEINSPEDLKGLTMRITSLGGRVMSELGVTVQAIPGGETFSALEQGTIDAAEFSGPFDDERLKFYEVAPYYYYPGWWEPGTTIALYINMEAWNSLSERYQEIVKIAAKEANLSMLTKYDRMNGEALARMVEQGVQLRETNEEVLKQADTATQKVLDELASENEDFRTVYNSWKAHQEATADWFKIGEFNFQEYLTRHSN